FYGKIEEEVYVCQSLGFEDSDFSDRVYKVKKALYELHQAPRAWYETLSTYLLDNGFQRGKIDKTLFIKRYKGDILLVQVYVDDIIFGSTKKELCNAFEKLMHEKFQMSSLGELTFFLGLQVQQKKDGIFISQDKYVDEILKKFGFTKVKTASTPIETQKPLLKDENGEEVDVYMYRSMIGSLMYLTSSRPDIMFVVGAYARYQVNPKVSHLHAVKRIFRLHLIDLHIVISDSDEWGSHTQRVQSIKDLSDIDHESPMITSSLSYPTCQRTHTGGPHSGPPTPYYMPGLSSQKKKENYKKRKKRQAHFSSFCYQIQMQLTMRLLLTISQVLRMPHPLHNHLIMFQRLILRQIQRDDDEDPEDDPIRQSWLTKEMSEMLRWTSDEDEDDDMTQAMRRITTAPSTEETEPFETDESATTPPPHPTYHMTARITIPEPVPIPAWSDSEVAKLLAISSPPASPLSPWSSHHLRFLIPTVHPDTLSPIIPLSPPSPVLLAPPPSPIRSLGYRAAMIRMRAEAATTSHSLPLPPPFILSPTRPDAPPPLPTSAPTSLPPLLLPSASRREDIPEVNLPPRRRLGIALGPRYEVGESSAAAAARPAGGLRADYGFVATMDREIRRDPERYVGYEITDSYDEIVETLQGAPVSTDTELGAHVRQFESMVRRDTDEIYTMLDDEQNTIERDDSTSGTGHHTAGAGDSLTGTGNGITRAGYCITGTAGNRYSQSCKRRLVAVLRLDFVMASHFVYSLLCITGLIPASKALARDANRNGVDSHTSGMGVRGSERVAQEYTYQDFMKCKPLYFKGTEGVIKFSTCTLLAGALTWWNSHVMTVTHDVAYAMTWLDLRKKMTDNYCLRNEMKKLEAELWNLKVIGTDVVKYN
ncbi:uncharacterized mitochondrial protein-like protein, partial [Tanacetum coccineum]